MPSKFATTFRPKKGEPMGWTDQQIQTLKKMWGNGYSASDIAKNLGDGVTRNAVIGKAHRLKLSADSGLVRQMPQPLMKTKGIAVATIKKVSGRGAPQQDILAHNKASSLACALEAPARLKEEQRVPLPRPIDVVKKTEGIPVTKAGEHHCRWPIGDPRSPDFRFCGCESIEGLPYCADHARVAYQTVSRKVRANAHAADAAIAHTQAHATRKAR